MKIDRLLQSLPTRTWARALILGSCFILTMAQAQEARIEAFGAAFSQTDLPAQNQARVYAYRAAESLNPAPINLYLNGRYHASLLRGGYTEFCLNPGRRWCNPLWTTPASCTRAKPCRVNRWTHRQAG